MTIKEGSFGLHTQSESHRSRRSFDVGRRIRRKRASACRYHISTSDYESSEARELKLASPTALPLEPFVKYMVPMLLVLVAMKYQGKVDTLFLENPAPMWCLIGATSIYWLIVGAVKRDPTLDVKCIHMLSRIAIASGVLSALSLLSMFLHYPFSLVPLVIWISLSGLWIVWPLLRESSINKMSAKVVVWGERGPNGNMTEEASLSV